MADQRVNRRLAASLAADVGYSRLIRDDHSETLAALTALRRAPLKPEVDEYGRRTVKTTGGPAVTDGEGAKP
jgi:hypothetical protein